MLDLKRTGSGRKLLQQIVSRNKTLEKSWATRQQTDTQKSNKNCLNNKRI
jgi:hypothetical protein